LVLAKQTILSAKQPDKDYGHTQKQKCIKNKMPVASLRS